MELLEDILHENKGGVQKKKEDWVGFQDMGSVTQEKEGNSSDDDVQAFVSLRNNHYKLMLKNRGLPELCLQEYTIKKQWGLYYLLQRTYWKESYISDKDEILLLGYFF